MLCITFHKPEKTLLYQDDPAVSCFLYHLHQVVLGDFRDFDQDDFTNGFSIFLDVFHSLMIVVVLLSVLIAIASACVYPPDEVAPQVHKHRWSCVLGLAPVQ
jgi:hypothetical protein